MKTITSSKPRGTRPRVVVVGAGFGGLRAVSDLAGSDVDVLLVDQRNHHTFQPLLYQVATAGLDVDDICHATRGIVARQSNARAVQATVTGIDTEAKQVHVAEGEPIRYDTCVLAFGAVTADFGVPGVAEHAFGLKGAAEAMTIRDHVMSSFERAARGGATAGATTLVVVGGGPTGVEMAGGLAELLSAVLRLDFPELDHACAKVVLVEGQDRLLGSFAPKLSHKAARRLEAMGVDVRLSTQVAEVSDRSVEFSDGQLIEAETVIWAAGVRAHPLAERMGLVTGRGGRVQVDAHLQAAGCADVFVIGDLAAATLDDGALVPQVAPAAVQGGRHVAAVIAADRAGEHRPAPFRYRDKGSMATIGRNAAVVELPSGFRLSGFVGWVAWLGLHLVMLIGFRNRANVVVNWAWNWLTWDRGSRIVLDRNETSHLRLIE